MYILVQFLPLILIPLILLLFPAKVSVKGYWFLLLAYVIAKLFEVYDGLVFESIQVISGHTLKHVVAALGIVALQRDFQSRYKSG